MSWAAKAKRDEMAFYFDSFAGEVECRIQEFCCGSLDDDE